MLAITTKEQTPTVSGEKQNKHLIPLRCAEVEDVAKVLLRGLTANGVVPSTADAGTLPYIAEGVKARYGWLTLSDLYGAFVAHVRGTLSDFFKCYTLPIYVNNIITSYVCQLREEEYKAHKAAQAEKHRREMERFETEERLTLCNWWLCVRHGKQTPVSSFAVLCVERRLLRLTAQRLPCSYVFSRDPAEAVAMSRQAVETLISDGITLGEWLSITPKTQNYGL